MRPQDTSFVGHELSGWFGALARQLPGGGDQAPTGVLSPVSLLRELSAVASGVIAGRRAPQNKDRVSLMIDLQRSLQSLGPQSSRLHQVAIADFRKRVLCLRQLLDDGAGAQTLRSGAIVLLEEFTGRESRSAALEDCIDAFRNSEFAGICEMRLRYLRTVLQAAGHEWSERSQRLLDALRARKFVDHAPRRESTLDEAPIDERLADADLVVREDHPPSGDAVVWLAYNDASISGIYIRKGPLEFYDSAIWSAVVEDKWTGNPSWTQPEELKEPEASFFLTGLPETGFVVVRVSLSNVPIAEARDRGANLARAAVELAGWERGWVRMNGEAVYVSPNWFGSLGFTDPRDHPPLRGRPYYSRIGEALGDLDEVLLQRITDGDQPAADLLTDLRWRRSVAAISDAEHRVALLVALIERILVPSASSSVSWHAAVERYCGLTMAFDDVGGHLWDAGYFGVAAADENAPDAAWDIVDYKGSFSVVVRLKEVIRHASALLPHVSEGSMESRMLAEVACRTQNSKAALLWFDSEHDAFQRKLARARRLRNAIAHGDRPVTEIVESVEPFLDAVTGHLIGIARHCVSTNIDMTTYLEHERLKALKTRAELQAGGSPDAIAI